MLFNRFYPDQFDLFENNHLQDVFGFINSTFFNVLVSFLFYQETIKS